MSKILKNQTASDVEIVDVGQTVPASGQLVIESTDDLLYKGSSDVVTLIGNSTLVVNDGTSDLSISDGIDLIKEIFPSEIELSVGAESVGSLSNPLATRFPEENTSSFGDIMTESMQPITQISATYGLTDSLLEIFEATGGTASVEDNMFVCQTGTNLGGFSVIRNSNATLYREGQGLMWRGTAIFTQGVANCLQFSGLFNLNDTLAFGYRGTDFGIIYENYGSAEIRSLQVTNTGNGNLNLTLDGTSYSIPITNSSVNQNAYEICDWLGSNQGVWACEQRGDTVYLQSQDTSERNGTYSFSGTSFNGTFTRIKAGSTKTINDIVQTNWDNNPSWFDPTKSNIYMIKLSYLGFGPIKFFVMNTITGKWELVHTIKPLGTATKPSISSRALKSGWVAASLGSTTNLTVKGGSSATFIEGDSKVFGDTKGHQATNSSVGSAYEAILTLRSNREYQGEVNLGRLIPITLGLANDAAKPVEYIVVKGGTLGITNYIDHKTTNSIASIDETAHVYQGDGEIVKAGVMSASGAPVINLEELSIELSLGQYLTVYARKRSGTNPEVNCSISWKEDL